nr:RagB/SusD family nutrient uptake outer membrane protein [uncultured Bacteroides sp.]
MNMKKYIYNYVLFSMLFLFASCDDYLDVLPDNRTEIDTEDKVGQLLVSAYSQNNPNMLFEMASDNTDNMANNYLANDRFQIQAYQWDDITEVSDDETPQSLWEGYYTALSTANMALDAIVKLGNTPTLQAEKGEALMCRAYADFMLANVFCDAYSESTAGSKLGLPYPTEPEIIVSPKYGRGTLAELYSKINADIEEGLPLIDNASYSVPSYHFNKRAAYAFAARFNLYYQKYDKAIAYATKALGESPKSILRDWKSWNNLSKNSLIQPNAYVDSDVQANFLLQSVYSLWGAIGGNYSLGDRYGHGAYISDNETIGASGPWGKNEAVLYYGAFINSSMPKEVIRKIGYYFEYTDYSSGIGNAHSVYSVFNAEETLLCRAEAYALNKEYTKAVGDINTLLSAFSSTSGNTLEEIKAYYSAIAYYAPTSPTVKKKFNTDFTIEKGTQEPLLQCILQLRRLITLHEGLRWQDIKRYGMVIYRRTMNANMKVGEVTDSLVVNDPRRAIQLPQDVITAGITANPR